MEGKEMKEYTAITIGENEKTIEDPFWLGNTIALYYTNHNPKWVIGPHCNLY